MSEPLPFRDRHDAGTRLAQRLAGRPPGVDVLVLALPRGGVPIGAAVARALGAELDVFVVRKLGLPGHEELAMGAIASGGVRVLNDDVVSAGWVTAHAIDAVAEREAREIERRERNYRGSRPPLRVSGRDVIVVDDGLATGATMRAAVRALRLLQPRSITVAVPVAAQQACADLAAEANEVVSLATPEPFQAVGLWYATFNQTTDSEVRQILEAATAR